MAKKLIDITGKRFNKVIAIEYVGNGHWLVRCDCGTISKTNRALLERGLKGCRKCTMSLPEGEAAFNEVYGNYKRHAKEDNRVFSLSKEEAKSLFLNNCIYCGSAPNNISVGKLSNFVYNGIDRVDNSVGYIITNCVSCCKLCNLMKHKLSEKEFLEHVVKIVDYRVKNA